MNIENITESEALRLYYALSRKFGWSGTLFTRGDVDSYWEEYTGEDMTDEDWEEVSDSWYWNSGLPTSMIERGNDLIEATVREVISNRKDNK